MNAAIFRILKGFCWVSGITLIVLGIGRVLFSMATIPGGGAVNATVDTETRAGGALLIAFGIAYVWAMRRPAIPSTLLRFLALTMALLAVSRLVSMVDAGLPHPIFVVSTGVEFAAAALTYWLAAMADHRQSTA